MPSPTYVPVIRTGVDVSFRDVTVTGTLAVTGAATMGAGVTVTGATATTTLAVSGNATVGGTLGVTGNATFTAGLTAQAPSSMNDVLAAAVTATSLGISGAAGFDCITVRVTGDVQPQFVVNGNGRVEFGGGVTPPDVALFRDGSARLHTVNDFVTEGNLICDVAGKTLRVREGANAASGAATLAAGTVTVNTTAVTATSRIQLTVQSLGTVADPKAVAVTARVAGTSFTVRSADATDTSVVAWTIIEPAA